MPKKFASLTGRTSLADQAYESIFKGIITGELRPGERLNEVHIAAQMEISRAPVREAIQRLRQKGLVVVAPGRQPTIIRMTVEEVRQLYHVRVALEHAALDEIAPKHGPDLAKRLVSVVQKIKRYAESGRIAETVDEEVRFHETIVAQSRNDLLIDMYSMLAARLRILLAMSIDRSSSASLEAVADCHDDIIRLIQEGDFDACKQALREHIWVSFPSVGSHIAAPLEDVAAPAQSPAG